MNIIDIYKILSTRMTEALMVHSQLSEYFRFLNAEGFATEQLYHYISESISRENVYKYIIEHHGFIIKENKIENPSVIPDEWYDGITINDISENKIKNYIKRAFSLWAEWEETSKFIYESCCKSLTDSNYIADSIYIYTIVKNVDFELSEIRKKINSMKNIDWDLPTILDQNSQYWLKDLYSSKINKIGKEVDIR